MPIAVLKEVTRSWVLGKIICDAWVMIDLLCCTASILHLVAIALDRYWSITNCKLSKIKGFLYLKLFFFFFYKIISGLWYKTYTCPNTYSYLCNMGNIDCYIRFSFISYIS